MAIFSSELSPDSAVVFCLCAKIPDSGHNQYAPLRNAEWNILRQRLAASSLRYPGELPGKSARVLSNSLEIDLAEAKRIVTLLRRSDALTKELKRLKQNGIWVCTQTDTAYPTFFLDRLNKSAPALLYAWGNRNLLQKTGIAVVGSRDLDEAGKAFAETIGQKIAASGSTLISGAARGADRTAMSAAIDAGGSTIGILAGGLTRSIEKKYPLKWFESNHLLLLCPFHPSMPFSAGGAMARNTLIYCLSQAAVVVSSANGRGGTWTGASECLRRNHAPLFVRKEKKAPEGNLELIRRGGIPLQPRKLNDIQNLHTWFEEQSEKAKHPLLLT